MAYWYLCYSLVLKSCSAKGLLLPSPLPSPSGMAKVCGSSLDKTQAQVETRTLGPFTCCFKGLGLVRRS